jgi:replicative DNA helicase
MPNKEPQMNDALPNAIESEKQINGSVMVDPRLIVQANANLQPHDFYSPTQRRIFEALIVLHRKGSNIDPILVAEQMRTDGGKVSVAEVTKIMTDALALTDLSDHIAAVKEKAMRREMIAQFNALTSDLTEGELETADIVATAHAAIVAMQGRKSSQVTMNMREAVAEVRAILQGWKEDAPNARGIPTGIPALDRNLRLRGLARGELTLIAARPSIGKTALMLQIVMQAIRLGIPTLFVSLEMLIVRLVMRMLPPIARVPNKAINPTTLKNLPEAGDSLFAALESIENFPLYFSRTTAMTKIVAEADHLIQTKGIQLVIFDYLTLIHNDATSAKHASTDVIVGEIAEAMKGIATRNNVAVMGAAQLSRESEKEGRRPKLTDLRDSGRIEQAADLVLFPYDPYVKDSAKDPDSIKDGMTLHIYCGKQREGERGFSVPMYYDKNLQTFSEIDNSRSV